MASSIVPLHLYELGVGACLLLSVCRAVGGSLGRERGNGCGQEGTAMDE